ncbi:MAG TPA: hypothetical protein VK579_11040, partial [Terriglobales bacterium]|nr:hypothetical protein [Terriglobales bacterium]
MGAGIPANGTSSDDSYLPTHTFPLAFLAAHDATGPPVVGDHFSGSEPLANRPLRARCGHGVCMIERTQRSYGPRGL